MSAFFTRSVRSNRWIPLHLSARTIVHNKQIVIIGAGTAGVSLVNLFKQYKAFNEKQIAIIEPSAEHYYQPGWTLVGGGLMNLNETIRPTKDLIPNQQNISFHPTSVTSVSPSTDEVELANGDTIKYEQLVIAAGIELKWEKIKGLSEAIGKDGVCTNYSVKYAESTNKFISDFTGGNALFTFPTPPIKCAGAPQKIMYLAEERWRNKIENFEDNVHIKYVCAIDKLFAVPKYCAQLEKICDKKKIEREFGLNLIEIDATTKKATFEVVGSPASETRVMDYDFIHVTPPMGPRPFLASNTDLTNAAGYVTVDKHTLQHIKYPNVFALGDCADLPTSKTAAAVAGQLEVVAINLNSAAHNQELTAKYDGYTSCPLVVGDNEGILAEFDYQLAPKETLPIDQSIPSKLNFLIKVHLLPTIYWKLFVEGKWSSSVHQSLRKFSAKVPAPVFKWLS